MKLHTLQHYYFNFNMDGQYSHLPCLLLLGFSASYKGILSISNFLHFSCLVNTHGGQRV